MCNYHRADDKKLVDTSVQANDYDIERRSGRLPARRRVIPTKFRYCIVIYYAWRASIADCSALMMRCPNKARTIVF